MIDPILIEGQTFKSSGGHVDKFNTSAALGISWRPGKELKSYEISNCVIDGSGAGEGLKLSFCYDVHVKNCIIHGGVEDCVDIVRGGDILFYKCKFISHDTKQHITVKGGAKNIKFVGCEFIGDYKKRLDGAFIDLGNWTDYDDVTRPRVRNIEVLDCKIKDSNRKILCRVLHSNPPKVENSDGWVFRVPRLFLLFFWLGQRLGWLGKRRRFAPENLEVYDIEL